MTKTNVAISAAVSILLLSQSVPSVAETSVAEGRKALQEFAKSKREKSRSMSFEEFKASVYKEPFEGGKFVVNGDTPIANEKLLREFFENFVKSEPPAPKPGETVELIVHAPGGVRAVWNSSEKHRLTYCVSTQFGARHLDTVAAMQAATQAWEEVADVDFHYLAGEDANCTPSNSAVVFDVRPVNSGQYLARAFFPNEARPARNVMIDGSSYELDPAGKLTLAGILRHELGHALGFRHEHTRPDSGVCFEDTEWDPETEYDAYSVMHYPQCNGKGDWSLTLTDFDKSGSACVYGPASGFAINPDVCKNRPAAQITTEVFENQTVAEGQERLYGPFRLAAGTQFKAQIVGAGIHAGDPDLYVRFDELASKSKFDCRPYTTGADEICTMDAPAAAQGASVMVHGYAQGAYSLKVTYTKRADQANN